MENADKIRERKNGNMKRYGIAEKRNIVKSSEGLFFTVLFVFVNIEQP